MPSPPKKHNNHTQHRFYTLIIIHVFCCAGAMGWSEEYMRWVLPVGCTLYVEECVREDVVMNNKIIR